LTVLSLKGKGNKNVIEFEQDSSGQLSLRTSPPELMHQSSVQLSFQSGLDRLTSFPAGMSIYGGSPAATGQSVPHYSNLPQGGSTNPVDISGSNSQRTCT